MTYKSIFPSVGLLALATLGCAQRTQPQDNTAVVQAINAAANHEIAAFSSGNVDSVLPVFTPDVVFLPPNEAEVHGRDGLRTWAQDLYQQYGVTARYPSSDVTVAGDWAVQRYKYVLTLTPKAGGAASQESGKGIHIFHREPDGSWLIAQDIWNSDAPTPTPQR